MHNGFTPQGLDNKAQGRERCERTLPCDVFHFWSPHSSGANFLFADGTVRFLGYDAVDVLPALATRAGGD